MGLADNFILIVVMIFIAIVVSVVVIIIGVWLSGSSLIGAIAGVTMFVIFAVITMNLLREGGKVDDLKR